MGRGERTGLCRWAELEFLVVRRARNSAAAVAIASATARISAIATAPRLTAMPRSRAAGLCTVHSSTRA